MGNYGNSETYILVKSKKYLMDLVKKKLKKGSLDEVFCL